MKKRLLSSLLLGALLVSSTSVFVSCKDYDDDVSGLQTQINDLTSLVSTKESTINSSISSMQSTLNALDGVSTSGISAADAATLAAAKQAVEDAKAVLEATINQNKSNIADLQRVNNEQDAAITAAQAAADQALLQLAQLSNLRDDVKAAIASMTQVKNDLAELSAKYNTLNDELKGALAEIAELKEAVLGQQAALDALTGGSSSDISGTINAILARLGSLEDQVKALSGAEGSNLADEINGIKMNLAELQAIKDEFPGVKEKVDALEALVNAFNAELNTLRTALGKELRSLVFQPSLYVDGIESIEYPYILDTLIEENPTRSMNRDPRTTAGYKDNGKQIIEATGNAAANLAKLRDWTVRNKNKYESFGPTTTVSYHLNPSRANVSWTDVVKTWMVREADVITRSDAKGGFNVTDKLVDGTNIFKVENGTITVGLRVDKPGLLAHHASPTETESRPGTLHEDGTAKTNGLNFDDIIALQVKVGNNDQTDSIITSDYAMIYPEMVQPKAIIWNKKPNKAGRSSINFDEKCPYSSSVNHVWDDPYEALGCYDASVYPDIELRWDSTGINIAEKLGIHFVRDCKTRERKVPGTWPFGEEAKWGYHYEFQRVGYSIDGNITIDSNYALFEDEAEADKTVEICGEQVTIKKGVSLGGVIKAWNVNPDGTTLKEQSRSSIGREPLVRVLVKRGNREVLDGYILIHITDETPEIIDDIKSVAFVGVEKEFDFCNGADVLETNWSQFSNIILTNTLNHMTKEQFDLTFGCTVDGTEYLGVPDLHTASTQKVAGTDYIAYDDVQIYDDMEGKKSTEASHAGNVRYLRNEDATTNHRFIWTLAAEDLEYYTHDGAQLPKEVVKYIRYSRRGYASGPEYLYIKMTAKLNRKAATTTAVTEKNINYWFSANNATLGADDGFDAIFFNPLYPSNGGRTFLAPYGGVQANSFTNDIITTFVNNRVNFTSGFGSYNNLGYDNAARNDVAKFYFVPENTEITAQDGKTYVITARKNYNDKKWNAFYCKYVANDRHEWKTPAENQAVLAKCVIDYNAGVFTNNVLYAVLKTNYDKASYTKDYDPIANLEQEITSGRINLVYRTPDNDITKEVLNAVGYKENHKNVLEELHTKIGIIAKGNCDNAIYVSEYAENGDNKNAGTFWASWNRPINVGTEASELQDAKDNGDFIYLVDMMKLHDWRGPADGYMYGDKQWLWAYYNVKSIVIDVNASQVRTNMHHPEITVETTPDYKKWPTLASVSNMVLLAPLKPDYDAVNNPTGDPNKQTIEIATQMPQDYPVYYNTAAKNDELLEALGISPEDDAIKEKFGGVYYQNNGEHVENFDLIIPVQVNYGWGRFISEVRVTIKRTLGN